MIVSLTGFMGCGKSAVGSRLASLLEGFDFVDLDEYVETGEQMCISSIFAESGESHFRDLEFKYLSEILSSGRNVVLSLGGGTVTNPRCEELVRRGTLCFYLKTGVEELKKNLSHSDRRPLLGDSLEGVAPLLALREPVYERVAHHIISCDSKYPMQIAREISSIINL